MNYYLELAAYFAIWFAVCLPLCGLMGGGLTALSLGGPDRAEAMLAKSGFLNRVTVSHRYVPGPTAIFVAGLFLAAAYFGLMVATGQIRIDEFLM